MQITDTIFVLIILIFSAIVHEVMHGVAAEWLGDKTARYAGRITLNPLPHLDPIGSILLPLTLALSHSPIWFAWAKPVPYNPYNLRADGLFRRWGEAIVAGAGPASNLVLATLCGLIIRLGILGPEVSNILFLVVVMNVMLCLFNLFPIPPLDGSKVFAALLPRSMAYQYGKVRAVLEMNPFLGMMIIIFVILGFGSAFSTLVYTFASFLAGV
ncbi:site-2 protease family protein [Candidatus Kaiserbacteria bacterium]|nr:site-2 protease family protein [Candidatus Kaiserbacteria bacterium]